MSTTMPTLSAISASPPPTAFWTGLARMYLAAYRSHRPHPELRAEALLGVFLIMVVVLAIVSELGGDKRTTPQKPSKPYRDEWSQDQYGHWHCGDPELGDY